MKQRLVLILALLVPIAALAANVWWHQQQRLVGEEVILPISGFDPRDLLSGHYLTYQIDYGIEPECTNIESKTPINICLSPQLAWYSGDYVPASCEVFIHGYCDQLQRFSAGIERFYVPEKYAKLLEDKVRDNQGKLVLTVDRQGNAAIRDLLIADQPWKQAIGVSN